MMSTVDIPKFSFIKPEAMNADESPTETVRLGVPAIFTPPPDVSTQDQMNLIEASGTLDFWNDPEEDQYSENDGDAI